MANEWIIELLKSQLDAAHVQIIDNSWQHAGHTAMKGITKTEGTHLDMLVVSNQFEGVPTIDRHRMVHAVLKPAFEQGLHALELKVYTPSQWEAKQASSLQAPVSSV